MRTITTLAVLILAAASPAADVPGEWHDLFDGTSFDGWTVNENKDTFSIREGAIVAHGPRSHLFYTGAVAKHEFKNFELRADVRTKPGANSGIFFHTRFQATGWPSKGYEVQINNSFVGSGASPETKRTGSLYGVSNAYLAIAKDDVWFTMSILVEGKRVRVQVGETLIVEYREPDSPPRSQARAGWVLSAGTFALQGHDPGSEVAFRNIRVRILPDDAGSDAPPASPFFSNPRLARLYEGNFPVVDFHCHLKGGLTIDDVVSRIRATGINYGVAVNCGLGFPVTDDKGALAFLKGLDGKPVFKGMQAEGREWVKMFSPDVIKQFDYVFTDAMTIVDDKGRRSRLWMENEVHIDDPQAFMDMLVDRIVTILRTEPIDIYANATFLPARIAKDYDALWTPARMDRVIQAAVEKGIAIEIGDKLRIPSIAFIRAAKAAGAKFTFGSNNGGRSDIGDLSYSLDVVEKCGLTDRDMFLPKWRRASPSNPAGR